MWCTLITAAFLQNLRWYGHDFCAAFSSLAFCCLVYDGCTAHHKKLFVSYIRAKFYSTNIIYPKSFGGRYTALGTDTGTQCKRTFVSLDQLVNVVIYNCVHVRTIYPPTSHELVSNLLRCQHFCVMLGRAGITNAAPCRSLSTLLKRSQIIWNSWLGCSAFACFLKLDNYIFLCGMLCAL